MITYQFAQGSRLSGDAQKVGRALARLSGGDAEAVVTAAAKPRSPLHSYFEWDDIQAARQYRLDQARHLIRAVIIVQRDGDRAERVARAFEWVHMEDSSSSPRVFVTQAQVQASADLYAQVIASLRKDLESYRERLAEFEAAPQLLAAIDVVIEAAA